jgi:hypothetical protein
MATYQPSNCSMYTLLSQQATSIDTTIVCSMLPCCTGKGRGVVATESIAPGQLLLCCEPLGVVTGAQQGQVTACEQADAVQQA